MVSRGSLIGVRASLEAFPTRTIGFIIAAYYVGFLVGAFSVQRVLMSVGHIRVFAAMASLASAAVLVKGLFVNPTTWIFLRTVTGFAMAGLYITSESWLNAPRYQRQPRSSDGVVHGDVDGRGLHRTGVARVGRSSRYRPLRVCVNRRVPCIGPLALARVRLPSLGCLVRSTPPLSSDWHRSASWPGFSLVSRMGVFRE